MGLAAVFVGLGAVFLVAPSLGAAIFGVPAPEGEALVYLPVIGLRDLAFGLYLAALAVLASRRTVGVVLAITVLIPLGDMILLALTRGLVPQLALHLLSGLAVGGVALWLLTRRDNDKREDIA
jgi:hypothetical protein